MSEYHLRARRAIGQLMGRQVVLQVVTFFGGVLLARTLGPAPFGLYVIATFVVSLFSLIGDFGLAPSFIQRKAELTQNDLQVGFTLQQILISGIVTVIWLTSRPLAVHLYPKQPEVVWLVRALTLNLYLSSWRTMSAIQLERELKFDRLAWIEALEVLVFQAIAIGLSLAGFGTWSFIVAAAAQGIVGTTLIYLAAPWTVRFRFDRSIAWELLRFGLPFQVQYAMNSLGAWVVPFIGGRLVGPVGVGYLMWAGSNGRKPLLVTENIMRVGFPHMARIQSDRVEVERTVTLYLTISVLAAGLWFCGIYCCTPAGIEWVYKSKWVPAATSLILYAAVLPLDMVGRVAGMSLNGIGRVRYATLWVGVSSVLNVLLALALVHWWTNPARYDAIAAAYLIASVVTIPWMLAGIQPGALPRIASRLAWILVPVAASIVVGTISSSLLIRFPLPVHVLITGLLTCVGYLGGALVAAPHEFRSRMFRFGRSGSLKALAVTVD